MKLNKKSVIWFIIGLIIGCFLIDFALFREKRIEAFKDGWESVPNIEETTE